MKNQLKENVYDIGGFLKKGNDKQKEVDPNQISLDFSYNSIDVNTGNSIDVRANNIINGILEDNISKEVKNEEQLCNNIESISNNNSKQIQQNFGEDEREIQREVTHYVVTTPTVNIAVTTEETEDYSHLFYSKVPQNIQGNVSIRIPKKVERVLTRYFPTSDLKQIHPDKEVAIELCLIFISNLTDTYFRINRIGFDSDDYQAQGWKNLSSKILRRQFSKLTPYNKIAEILIKGSPLKGPIIECDFLSIDGIKCYSYRLTEPYQCKGISTYNFKTDFVKNLQNDRVLKSVNNVIPNVISRSVLKLIEHVNVPSEEELMLVGKQLVKKGHTNKKGKILTLLGNRKKEDWEDKDVRVFLEDHIALFSYLTKDNFFLIPTPGSEKSGKRVVDSFTLMPRWCRKLLKIDNEPIAIIDFSCLHPNIAISEFKGNSRWLTHDSVALMSGIVRDEVKNEHLSFLNKEFWQMKESPLFKFYMDLEPKMMNNLLEDRRNSKYGYKQTSRTLLGKEVQIMTSVFEALEKENILAGYVYDAVFCKESDRFRVQEIMNRMVLEHSVYTTAKIED
jgi:hypothetical protein